MHSVAGCPDCNGSSPATRYLRLDAAVRWQLRRPGRTWQAYRLGMIVFVVPSAARAGAPSLPVLVATRIVQGTGAALMTSVSLALIRETFLDPAAGAHDRRCGGLRAATMVVAVARRASTP